MESNSKPTSKEATFDEPLQTVLQALHETSPYINAKLQEHSTEKEKFRPLPLLKPSSSILKVVFPWVLGLIQPDAPNENFEMFKTVLEGRSNPKVLFLSEGVENDVYNSHPLADIVAKRLPEVHVIKTDSSYPSAEQKEKNIRKVRLDNSGSWESLNKEEFDVIVLRNGLCCCSSGNNLSCAGIEMTESSTFAFLERIVKLLHKTCLSLAVLHGVVSEGPLICLWGLAAAKLKKTHPFVHVYLIPDEGNRLFAILIKTVHPKISSPYFL